MKKRLVRGLLRRGPATQQDVLPKGRTLTETQLSRLGTLLVQARTFASYTQTETAAEFNPHLSLRQYQRYEAGQAEPSAAHKRHIVRLLGLDTVAQLYEKIGQGKTEGLP